MKTREEAESDAGITFTDLQYIIYCLGYTSGKVDTIQETIIKRTSK